MINTAIYPGTFDPITNGHLDLVTRSANLFSQIILAVAANPNKKPLFSLSERVILAKKATAHLSNVRVYGFNSLMTDFIKKHQAKILVRGLRSIYDFEYELQLSNINSHFMPDLETIFLIPAKQWQLISSSLVKELAYHGGNISQFVPPDIHDAVIKKISNTSDNAGNKT